jgi:cell division protein FtsB
MTTQDTTTNGGTKSSSDTISEAAGVISTNTLLPSDNDLPKEAPSMPTPVAIAEPHLSRKLPVDDDTAFGERKPADPWPRRLKIGGVILVVLGMLAMLGMLLYSCNGVRDLKGETASLGTDVTKLQNENKEIKSDMAALKTGVDNLNKKVDPMINNVEALTGTIDDLNKKVNGKADQTAVDDLKKNKADKAYVDSTQWRITRLEKKIEETRVAVAKEPMPTEEKKTNASIETKQSTHKYIRRYVPRFIDTYVPVTK